MHPNKSTTQELTDTLMGSRAFAAVARFVLYCGYPVDGDRKTRALGALKNQYGDTDWTMYYHIETAFVPDPDGDEPLETSIFTPDFELDVPILEIIGTGEGEKRMTECTEWLKGYLVTRGGTALHADTAAVAREEGYSKGQPRTARKSLEIRDWRTKDFPSKTMWGLPSEEPLPLESVTTSTTDTTEPSGASGASAITLQDRPDEEGGGQ